MRIAGEGCGLSPEVAIGDPILRRAACPLVGRLRADVERVLEILGLREAADEIEGTFPSPTLLIDGIDVSRQPLGSEPAFRLDLPTTDEIVAAMLYASEGSELVSASGGASRESQNTGTHRPSTAADRGLSAVGRRRLPWPTRPAKRRAHVLRTRTVASIGIIIIIIVVVVVGLLDLAANLSVRPALGVFALVETSLAAA